MLLLLPYSCCCVLLSASIGHPGPFIFSTFRARCRLTIVHVTYQHLRTYIPLIRAIPVHHSGGRLFATVRASVVISTQAGGRVPLSDIAFQECLAVVLIVGA